MLALSEAVFAIDDIADKSLDKRRQSQLDIITITHGCLQSCSAKPKNIRKQAKAIFGTLKKGQILRGYVMKAVCRNSHCSKLFKDDQKCVYT